MMEINKIQFSDYLRKEIIEKIEFRMTNFAVFFILEAEQNTYVFLLTIDDIHYYESPDYKDLKKVEIAGIEVKVIELANKENIKAIKEDVFELKKATKMSRPFVFIKKVQARIFKDIETDELNINVDIDQILLEISHFVLNAFNRLKDVFDLIDYVRARKENLHGKVQIKDNHVGNEVFRYFLLMRIIKYSRIKHRKQLKYVESLNILKLGIQLQWSAMIDLTLNEKPTFFNPEQLIMINSSEFSAKKLIEKSLKEIEKVDSRDIQIILDEILKELSSIQSCIDFCMKYKMGNGKKPSMFSNIFKKTASFQNFFEKVQSKISKQSIDQKNKDKTTNGIAFILSIDTFCIQFFNRNESLFDLSIEDIIAKSFSDCNLLKLSSFKLSDDSCVYSEMRDVFMNIEHSKENNFIKVLICPLSGKLNTYIISKAYFFFKHPFFSREKVRLRSKKSNLGFQFELKIEKSSEFHFSDTFGFENQFVLKFSQLSFDKNSSNLDIKGLKVDFFSRSSQITSHMITNGFDFQFNFNQTDFQVFKFNEIELFLDEKIQKTGENFYLFFLKLRSEFFLSKVPREMSNDASILSTSGLNTRKNSDNTE